MMMHDDVICIYTVLLHELTDKPCSIIKLRIGKIPVRIGGVKCITVAFIAAHLDVNTVTIGAYTVILAALGRAHCGVLSAADSPCVTIEDKAERESIRNIDLERYYDHERIYEKIREDGNNIRMLSLDDPKYNYYSMVAVCSCGKTLRYIPMEKRDYRMCCAAVEDDPEAMLYVPDEYKERVVKDIRSRNHWIKYIFENDFLADMLIK